MRILATVLFAWTSASAAFAIVLARVLRAVSVPEPQQVEDVADWNPDATVDSWSQLRIDAEFSAITDPYEVDR